MTTPARCGCRCPDFPVTLCDNCYAVGVDGSGLLTASVGSGSRVSWPSCQFGSGNVVGSVSSKFQPSTWVIAAAFSHVNPVNIGTVYVPNYQRCETRLITLYPTAAGPIIETDTYESVTLTDATTGAEYFYRLTMTGLTATSFHIDLIITTEPSTPYETPLEYRLFRTDDNLFQIASGTYAGSWAGPYILTMPTPATSWTGPAEDYGHLWPCHIYARNTTGQACLPATTYDTISATLTVTQVTAPPDTFTCTNGQPVGDTSFDMVSPWTSPGGGIFSWGCIGGPVFSFLSFYPGGPPAGATNTLYMALTRSYNCTTGNITWTAQSQYSVSSFSCVYAVPGSSVTTGARWWDDLPGSVFTFTGEGLYFDHVLTIDSLS